MVSKTKTRSNSSALVDVASSRIEFNLSNPIQSNPKGTSNSAINNLPSTKVS